MGNAKRSAPHLAGLADSEFEEQLDRKLAHTIELLSQAAFIGVCRGRMRDIVRNLDWLSGQPAVAAEIRAASAKLLQQWREAQREHFGQDADGSALRH